MTGMKPLDIEARIPGKDEKIQLEREAASRCINIINYGTVL